jgi:hypothetical protein
MSFRDWLYSVMTGAGQNVAAYLDNRIYWVILNLWDWYAQVGGWKDQMNQMVSSWVLGWPEFLGNIMLYMMSLATNYIIAPISGVFQALIRMGISIIGDLYSTPSHMYLPSYWLLWLFTNVRDRLINLLDDTASLLSQLQSWATTNINNLTSTVQGWMNDITSWRGSISTWIGQNLYNPLQKAKQDILDLGLVMGSLIDQVHVITQDPAAWVWTAIQPTLRAKVESWLNSIWYTRF